MNKYQLFKRAISDVVSISRKYYLSFIVKVIVERSLPFVNFLYMSWVLLALAQSRFEDVVQLIIYYLIIFGVVQVVLTVISPYVDNGRQLLDQMIMQKPYEKMMKIEFIHADSSKTHELLHHVSRDMYTNNSSILNISRHLDNILENLVSVTWAIILLTPLFTQSTNYNEDWQWFNTMWPNIILIALLMLSIYLQIVTVNRLVNVLDKGSEDLRHANANYFYLFNKLSEVESGKEIRLYKVASKINEILQKNREVTGKMFSEFYYRERVVGIVNVVMSQLLVICMYALIGVRVLVGGLSIELVVQLSGALSQLMSALSQGLSSVSIFAQTGPLERYYELMDLPDEETIGSLPVEKRLDTNYQLSVEDLSFTFPESQTETLHNITESFEAGKKYAIVGENGSGKTTFIKLLMRLYEPTGGEVRLNNITSSKYKLSEYYRLFSVVFQDFRLLALSLGENIAVNPTYNEDEVKGIIEQVNMSDLMPKLNRGLDTYLGTEFDDSGVNVSGGQAQKIAMARALYKNSKVMILDEPTAALDPVAEFEIYQQFDKMVQDKTAFYISHRLSSCRFCDEILVFDEGRVVQRGSHEELVKQPGKYFDLWNAQAQYYT